MGWVGGGPAGGTFAAEERRRLVIGCENDDGGPTDDDEVPTPACEGSFQSRGRYAMDGGLESHSDSIVLISGR